MNRPGSMVKIFHAFCIINCLCLTRAAGPFWKLVPVPSDTPTGLGYTIDDCSVLNQHQKDISKSVSDVLYETSVSNLDAVSIEELSAVKRKAQDLVLGFWKEAEFTVYGSSEYGLFIRELSDIDIRIELSQSLKVQEIERLGYPDFLPDTSHGITIDEALLLHLSEYLKQKSENVAFIPSHSYPLVRFELDGIRIELLMGSRETSEAFGIMTTHETRKTMGKFRDIKNLNILLKLFLHKKGLSDGGTGGLTSFVLVLMTRFFMEAMSPRSLNFGSLLLEFLQVFRSGSFMYNISMILRPIDDQVTGYCVDTPPLEGKMFIQNPTAEMQHNAAFGVTRLSEIQIAFDTLSAEIIKASEEEGAEEGLKELFEISNIDTSPYYGAYESAASSASQYLKGVIGVGSNVAEKDFFSKVKEKVGKANEERDNHVRRIQTLQRGRNQRVAFSRKRKAAQIIQAQFRKHATIKAAKANAQTNEVRQTRPSGPTKPVGPGSRAKPEEAAGETTKSVTKFPAIEEQMPKLYTNFLQIAMEMKKQSEICGAKRLLRAAETDRESTHSCDWTDLEGVELNLQNAKEVRDFLNHKEKVFNEVESSISKLRALQSELGNLGAARVNKTTTNKKSKYRFLDLPSKFNKARTLSIENLESLREKRPFKGKSFFERKFDIFYNDYLSKIPTCIYIEKDESWQSLLKTFNSHLSHDPDIRKILGLDSNDVTVNADLKSISLADLKSVRLAEIKSILKSKAFFQDIDKYDIVRLKTFGIFTDVPNAPDGIFMEGIWSTKTQIAIERMKAKKADKARAQSIEVISRAQANASVSAAAATSEPESQVSEVISKVKLFIKQLRVLQMRADQGGVDQSGEVDAEFSTQRKVLREYMERNKVVLGKTLFDLYESKIPTSCSKYEDESLKRLEVSFLQAFSKDPEIGKILMTIQKLDHEVHKSTRGKKPPFVLTLTDDNGLEVILQILRQKEFYRDMFRSGFKKLKSVSLRSNGAEIHFEVIWAY